MRWTFLSGRCKLKKTLQPKSSFKNYLRRLTSVTICRKQQRITIPQHTHDKKTVRTVLSSVMFMKNNWRKESALHASHCLHIDAGLHAVPLWVRPRQWSMTVWRHILMVFNADFFPISIVLLCFCLFSSVLPSFLSRGPLESFCARRFTTSRLSPWCVPLWP